MNPAFLALVTYFLPCGLIIFFAWAINRRYVIEGIIILLLLAVLVSLLLPTAENARYRIRQIQDQIE